MRSAARITPDLLDAIARLDDGSRPIAEVARRVAAAAEQAGDPRPSYERVRQLVHDHRLQRARAHPSRLRVVLEGGARLRSKESMIEGYFR